MNRIRSFGLALGAGMVLSLLAPSVAVSASAQPQALTTVTFYYNGIDGTDGTPQLWEVPPGVTKISVDAYGAGGSGNAFGSRGGPAAHVNAVIIVAPSQLLTIYVGGKPAFNNASGAGGFNGGGAPGAVGSTLAAIPGGGGGASDVRTGAGGLADRILVAAGGGGAGAPASQNGQTQVLPASGGVGGNSSGDGATGVAVQSVTGGTGGLAGTQLAGGFGGQGGTGGGACGVAGQAGDLGVGGNASSSMAPGGGGGGGYYGGGSGGTGECTTDLYWVAAGGGGGGGSSLVPEGGTVTDGVWCKSGRVVFKFVLPG